MSRRNRVDFRFGFIQRRCKAIRAGGVQVDDVCRGSFGQRRARDDFVALQFRKQFLHRNEPFGLGNSREQSIRRLMTIRWIDHQHHGVFRQVVDDRGFGAHGVIDNEVQRFVVILFFRERAFDGLGSDRGKFDFAERFAASLSGSVESADGFDFVVEPLDSNRLRLIRRIDVEQSAAAGEFTWYLDRSHGRESGFGQPTADVFGIDDVADRQFAGRFFETRNRWHPLDGGSDVGGHDQRFGRMLIAGTKSLQHLQSRCVIGVADGAAGSVAGGQRQRDDVFNPE